MNKDNAAQFLPLVKALAEGKTIQFCVMGNQWEDVKSVGFNYDPKRYRIKSEPRVLYVNEYADGGTAYRSRSHAIGVAGPLALRTAVKYVEVIEHDQFSNQSE